MKNFGKKILAMAVAYGLMMSMAACSSEEENTAPVALGGQEQAQVDSDNADSDIQSGAEAVTANHKYTFTVNGVSFGVNDEAAPIIAALGDGYSYFESNSCAFQGLDKVYTYPAFIIRTYPMNDVDYINSIEFTNDTVQTEEGLYIGCTQDDIEATYDCSDANYPGNGIVLYNEDGTEALTFVVAGGQIVAISYAMVSE